MKRNETKERCSELPILKDIPGDVLIKGLKRGQTKAYEIIQLEKTERSAELNDCVIERAYLIEAVKYLKERLSKLQTNKT